MVHSLSLSLELVQTSPGEQLLLRSNATMLIGYSCDGITEIVWRGKDDGHGTVPSVSPPTLTRFGTSIQITKRTQDQCERLTQMIQTNGGNLESIMARITGQREVKEQINKSGSGRK